MPQEQSNPLCSICGRHPAEKGRDGRNLGRCKSCMAEAGRKAAATGKQNQQAKLNTARRKRPAVAAAEPLGRVLTTRAAGLTEALTNKSGPSALTEAARAVLVVLDVMAEMGALPGYGR